MNATWKAVSTWQRPTRKAVPPARVGGVVEHAHRAVGRQRAVTLLAPVEDEDVGLYGRHGEPQCGACGSESDRGCLHPYKDTCLAARTGYGPISAGL